MVHCDRSVQYGPISDRSCIDSERDPSVLGPWYENLRDIISIMKPMNVPIGFGIYSHFSLYRNPNLGIILSYIVIEIIHHNSCGCYDRLHNSIEVERGACASPTSLRLAEILYRNDRNTCIYPPPRPMVSSNMLSICPM